MTKMAESYPSGWKTLWEKEKLLVMSNFSFSHSIFKRLVSQGSQKVSLCGNGLKHCHISHFKNQCLSHLFTEINGNSLSDNFAD